MESFSLLHRMPSLSQFLDRLAEGRTLIQYDTRGTGLSQRGSKDFSPRALAADIAAVVRDVGERQIMVWGSHGGTIRGMAFAIYYPELVFKLAMYTPLPVNTAYFPVQALHAMASLWRTDPRSRPRVAVKTKRCSLRGEEANSHQRRTAPWRKEYPLAPGLNRPSPAWWKMVSGIRTALPS